LATDREESRLAKHIFFVIHELFGKWDVREVEKMIVVLDTALLFLFVFFGFFALCFILGCLGIIEGFLGILVVFELLCRFWGFFLINEVGLGDGLVMSWEASGNLEHLSSTLAV
jgi:hypothetical protein